MDKQQLEAIRARDADYNDVFEAQASMSKDIAHRLVAWPVADRRALLAYVDELRSRLAEAAQTEERLRRGLQFYADGSHYEFGDPADWDSVSGEPSNFLCDEHGSTIEDGSVAKRILEGANIGPDDDGEFVFIDAPRPADSATVGQDCQTLASLDSEDAARFRWLCDDHADKAIRHLRDSLLERMSVMSLSAVRAAISIHLSNVSEQAKNSHHE